jgi:uncharacterized cofD-like protein
VLIGGGTGAPQLLVALRPVLTGAQLAVVVPVTDTGRSTGVIRRTLRIPGPGDLRHCLTTLAEPGSEWSALLEQRLQAPDHPDLDGMSAGNLLLGALTQQTGNIGQATEQLADLLGVREAVLPVSVENIHLAAHLADGIRVTGELEVRRPGKAAIQQLFIEGAGQGVWPPTRDILRDASVLVVGPGSLWTSIGGVLAVPGVQEAIAESSVHIVFVCNTTVQPGQTDGLDLERHVDIVSSLLGRPPDAVIANSSVPDDDERRSLEEHGLSLVLPTTSTRPALEARHIRLETAELLLSSPGSPTLWQKLHTAYHDMEKTAKLIGELVATAPVG